MIGDASFEHGKSVPIKRSPLSIDLGREEQGGAIGCPDSVNRRAFISSVYAVGTRIWTGVEESRSDVRSQFDDIAVSSS